MDGKHVEEEERGYDWVLLKLGLSGYPISFEINTHYFKGNYPDSFYYSRLLIIQ